MLEVKEGQLVKIMLSSLVFNVLLNHRLVTPATDRGDVITVRPELASPQFLLDGWHELE